ncbi:MAG: type I pullulanase [Lachnospiraceae bacterium]|nr:type I pullulanase [Lachnospiraceae bacterium]
MAVTVFAPHHLVQAAEGVTLKLHFHRESGEYDGWDVWLWEYGKDGAGYAFADENGEKVATMKVSDGTTTVGFIVRTESWEKDISDDQFIDIAEMVSGTVHIYVESGVPGYTKTYGEDAVKGIKVKNAVYDGDKTVAVTMTAKLDTDPNTSFVLEGEGVSINVESVSLSGNSVYNLKLTGELNPLGKYTLKFEGTSVNVSMPDYYSTEKFEKAYTYTGNDLGATWTKEKTSFRVWAPTAKSLKVKLYEGGTAGKNDLIEEIAMSSDVNGTWVAEKTGDLNGVYYTYEVNVDGKTSEVVDPYARTTGVNGKRAMVIDLDSTDPEGWSGDKDPNADLNVTDCVIYETHIRDITASESANVVNAGKFLGLTETGTVSDAGIATGLDHIKELGVTHLHILPFYDFGSVDETKEGGYNWGYDPVNYNVPEGSYSTNAYDGKVRVAEVKEMVKALHENGISVVMDVVYNHVYSASDFCINKLVPNYFSRTNANGSYSNGSGCGNDTATERAMVKKYVVDSVNYWADEYHIDGFRFDLVGLMDVDTINEIVETVHKTHPNVIFYGEGWTLTTSPTKDNVVLATQTNSKATPGFAYFNDKIRDDIKGSVFDTSTKGFVSGAGYGVAISRDLSALEKWSTNPTQIVNYASCHDNNTLFDRLHISNYDSSEEDLIAMNNLAAAVYLTAEGIPFMSAGEEMLRQKINSDGTFNGNSYNAGDAVNVIDYDLLANDAYANVFEYYKGLIAFRKDHPVLRLTSAEEVAEHVSVVKAATHYVIMDITGGVDGEKAEEMYLVYNGQEEELEVELPKGKWGVYVNKDKAGNERLSTASGKVKVEPLSAMVLVKEGASSGIALPLIIGGAVVVLAAAGFVILKKRNKKGE